MALYRKTFQDLMFDFVYVGEFPFYLLNS